MSNLISRKTHANHNILVRIRLLGENNWDDDAEWVKEYVGDINRCYH